ncbi:pilin [Stenotrophomonas tumulicola]|uniref:DUF4339 domain-containing protein n=1 Tax=Stenotrophomonas tumulicola TaxID=1685415 RepID=A0A7W3FL03_9GAMM|nr:DUF4339 domain-containing protein [Stenotrophomonas tumulicola]
MSEWFHAEGNRQIGPVSAEDIAALFREDRIGLETLVWRDGLPAWQPLHSVADELGLTAVPPPPAAHLESTPPQLPPAVPLPSSPYAGPPSSIPVPPRKSGLSGCALTAIIGGGALVVLVPVCAILAAIALPSYNDYVIRSKVAQSISALQPLKLQVQEFNARQGRCPTGTDPGFPGHDQFIAQGFSSVQFGRFENRHCGIEATLATGKSTIDGDLLWLEFDPDATRWECSGETEDKYLPVDCRG